MGALTGFKRGESSRFTKTRVSHLPLTKRKEFLTIKWRKVAKISNWNIAVSNVPCLSCLFWFSNSSHRSFSSSIRYTATLTRIETQTGKHKTGKQTPLHFKFMIVVLIFNDFSLLFPFLYSKKHRELISQCNVPKLPYSACAGSPLIRRNDRSWLSP